MLVIGNGESRRDLDLKQINMSKIGCNAIYRDCFVEDIVCVDRKMLKEILRTTYRANVYTRKEWFVPYRLDKRLRMLPKLPFETKTRMDEPMNWGSGPYAVLLGAMKAEHTIRLVGFDLFSKDRKFNNIYKDTENYNSSSKKSVDPSYWIYQISCIFDLYKNKNFIIYNDKDWPMPDSWKLANVSLDKLGNLV